VSDRGIIIADRMTKAHVGRHFLAFSDHNDAQGIGDSILNCGGKNRYQRQFLKDDSGNQIHMQVPAKREVKRVNLMR